MIKVNNVTKKYISNHKIEYNALNGITFSLPSKGLVFILGKSGSGKSTLLNALGTLDGVTSGSIQIGDVDYEQLKEKDFDNIRNNEIGFVFQDCNLIEDFNVYDNLAIALDLKRINHQEEIIDDILRKVGLPGIENKFPKELSGGQRQRVALSRTLVKNPRIILADEPTGNVDTETGKLIINLLKEYAKDALVVVVSHNRDDARNYANRIIEIQDGLVINNYCPEQNSQILVDDEKIYLPLYRKLNDDDIKVINENKDKEKVFEGLTAPDLKQLEIEEEESEKFEIKKQHISNYNLWGYANKLYKTRMRYSFLLVILSVVLLILTGIVESFATYDPNQNITKQLSDSDIIFTSSGKEPWATPNKYYSVSDETKKEVEKIIGHNAYDCYNIRLYFNYYHTSQNNVMPLDYASGLYSFSVNNQNYINSSNLLVKVDEGFLKNRYGDFEVLAGDIHDQTGGVIITDYLADSMINIIKDFSDFTYNDILKVGNFNIYSPKVVAIIKTNYKEKYKNIFDDTDINHKSTAYVEFLAECTTRYAALYTLDDNFLEHFNEGFTYTKAGGYRGSKSYIKGNEPYFRALANLSVRGDNLVASALNMEICHGVTSKVVDDNKCYVSYTVLNKLFGTDYKTPGDANNDLELYKGKTITIDTNKDHNCHGNSYEYIIDGILDISSTGNYIATSQNNYQKIAKDSFYRVAINVNEYENFYDLMNKIEDLNLYQLTLEGGVSVRLYDYILVFQDVFKVLYYICIVGVLFLIAFDGFNSIRKNKYNIGVMRSIGFRNWDIIRILMINSLYNTTIISIFYVCGSKLLSGVVNRLLVNAVAAFTKIPLSQDFVIIPFNAHQTIVNIIIVFIVTIISVCIQTLTVKRIKPIDIIRKK